MVQVDLTPDKPFFPGEMIGLLSRTIPSHLPILLVGKPGHGKTDVVYQAAAACDADIITAHPIVDDPVDYKGMPAVIEDQSGSKTATFLPFGNLKNLIDATKPTVYFMDDLGQAPKTVQAAAMQLLLARKINGHHVSDKVTFLAASNRKEDKSGVVGLLEAVKDRFAMICELETSLADWVKWALDPVNAMPPELVSFIRYMPEYLSKFKPSKDMVKSPTPRTIAMIGHLMKTGIPKELELRAYCSAAGKEFALAFTGFLRVYRDMPDPDAVLMNPSKADIPSETSSLYALCGALSARCSDNNIERFVTYTNRLPEEFAVMAMRDAVSRNQSVSKTNEFSQWVSDHQDVLI